MTEAAAIFVDPNTGRCYELADKADLRERIPVFYTARSRQQTTEGQRLSEIESCDDHRTRIRIPSSESWIVLSVTVPPWEGWRPSWERRVNPGRLELKLGSRVVFNAPLLVLADAYLNGVRMTTPLNGSSPHLQPLMRSAEAVVAAEKLVEPFMVTDVYDFEFRLRPTSMCPADFECNVELRGLIAKPYAGRS